MPLTSKDILKSGKLIFPVEIANSVLFDGSTDYLAWTPISVGNRTTFTINMDIKGTGPYAGFKYLVDVRNGSGTDYFYVGYSADKLQVWGKLGGSFVLQWESTQTFVDATAFGNLNIAVDTTQADAADRLKCEWNGKPIPGVFTTNVAQNTNLAWNSLNTHSIAAPNTGAGNLWGGYVTRVRCVDGQALPASTFGQFSDQVTGLWVPKEVVIPEYSYYSSDILAGATNTCNGTFRGTRTCSDAFDPSTDYDGTWLSSEYTWPNWLKSVLPEAKVARRYILTCSDSYWQNEYPIDWTFEGSNDGTNWDILDTRTGESNTAAAQTKKYDFENSTAYTQYRIVFTKAANASYVSVANFEVYTLEADTWGENGRYYKFDNAANLGEDSAQAKVAQDPLTGPNLMLNATGYQSSYYDSSQAALYMFDNLASTFWQAATGANNPQWAAGKPANPFAMAAYSLLIRDEGGIENRVPQSWQLQGSNDSTNGSNGTWDVLDTQTNKTLTRGNTYTYEIPNTTVYAMYRLYVTQTGSETLQGNISELRGYGVLPDASPNDATVNGSPVQTLDTPTNNYCTWNTLENNGYNSVSTLSNGNTTAGTSGGSMNVSGTLIPTGGKWYYEVTYTGTSTSLATQIGGALRKQGANHTSGAGTFTYNSDGTVTGLAGSSGAGLSSGDVVGIAYDVDAWTMEFFINNVSQGGTRNITVTNDGDGIAPFVNGLSGYNDSFAANFGATGFTYTPPDGFKALCTANLPDPSVMKSASAAQAITRVGEGGPNTNRLLNGTATASSTYGSNTPSKAVDGVSSSTPSSYWYANQFTNQWLQVIPQTPFALNRYVIDCGYANNSHCLGQWTLEGYKDGGWTTLDSQSGFSQASWTSKSKEFTISNITVYDYYRLSGVQGVNPATEWPWIFEFAGYNTNASTSITLPDMEGGPDFVNIKARDAATHWVVTDKLRGATKTIFTNLTNAEQTEPLALTAFNADGYSLGTWSNVNNLNTNYLDLALKADALIEYDSSLNVVSSVDRGTNYGLNIIIVDGNETPRLIPHLLGKTPTFILAKCMGAPAIYSAWYTWNKFLANGYAVPLTTGAQVNDNGVFGTNAYSMSATHFSVGTYMNQTGYKTIFYVFTDSDIFKAFSYTGNGSADGPFVNLGGKPLSIPFLKNTTDAATDWYNYDSVRDPFNVVDKNLFANTSNSEGSSSPCYNFTAQGAKLITTGNDRNGNGDLFVGLAILESTKYSNAF